ncbi:transketolase family protein [Caldiplasma sukawensis]
MTVYESQREEYGKTIAELGEKHSEIVVLDADLSSSTKSMAFGKKFPDRFFNMGISEQSMVTTAAGLALGGFKAFASTFAVFLTRTYEQLRQSICYNNIDVKFVVTHAGITVGEDGATHQIVEDVGLMSGLPNMKVIVPADSIETRSVITYLVENTKTPYYVRLSREKFAVVNQKDYEFKEGKNTVLKDGSDLTIFCNGSMIDNSLKAAEILKEKGLDAAVINVSSIKPMDKQNIIKYGKNTGHVVTAEEHSIYNGLGSRVCEVLSENYPVPVVRIGMRDSFGKSGKAWELFDYFHMGVKDIVEAGIKSFREESGYETVS